MSQWSALAADAPRLGRAGRSPGLIEFIDYRCEYCASLHDSIAKYLALHPHASVTIRFSILPGDTASQVAAAAALCAYRQHRFSAMHTELLRNIPGARSPDWDQVVQRAEIPDVALWKSCRTSSTVAAALALDSAWAERLGIIATPAILTGDGKVRFGVVPVQALEEWYR
jgi:protein-disulfide isomerase